VEICPSCGEPAFFCVADLCYETREIQVDACCDANLAGWIDAFAVTDRRTRVDWMARETGLAVRDVIADGSCLSWTLDYGLILRTSSFRDAVSFVNEHHRHNPAPQGWKFGAAVYNGEELIGVVMAGRPVSAALQKQGCLEINRDCVKLCSPKGLAWNACSMLYGYACREGFKRGYKRIITYTHTAESGVSLRAAGFVPVTKTRGGSWDRQNRPRADRTSTEAKVRWERWVKGVPIHQMKFPWTIPEDAPLAA
jgi:hypothetical protein